ncbi:PREDICTED: AT-rich interactive domain-containing protein 5B-like [Priapulus caudatus]|uniref:AT-rich interactive domain-containing protein 5B-like n=1 Tax=Priapulus caudatus TaxID=37621 RepID=A0ABM1E1P3_PRICU|nr:PREDICTED: AT-rich interactive domain-containing protein 5B-like [Priapulus caudatus]
MVADGRCGDGGGSSGEDDDDSISSSMPVRVLSYSQYCRYRALLRRLHGVAHLWMSTAVVAALGGITVRSSDSVYFMFCRSTFDHPHLATHQLICDHLAPVFKGRKRKKPLSVGKGDDELTEDSMDSSSTSSSRASSRSSVQHSRDDVQPPKSQPSPRNGYLHEGALPSPTTTTTKQPTAADDAWLQRRPLEALATSDATRLARPHATKEELEFFQSLCRFMREMNMPIERIPSLGFKQVDLCFMFAYTQQLGGHAKVTARRLWKHIYDKMGGHPGNTSAATSTRRLYEKLLLLYEQHRRGEPLSKPILTQLCPKLSAKVDTQISADQEQDTAKERKKGHKPHIHAQEQQWKEMQLAHGKARHEAMINQRLQVTAAQSAIFQPMLLDRHGDKQKTGVGLSSPVSLAPQPPHSAIKTGDSAMRSHHRLTLPASGRHGDRTPSDSTRRAAVALEHERTAPPGGTLAAAAMSPFTSRQPPHSRAGAAATHRAAAAAWLAIPPAHAYVVAAAARPLSYGGRATEEEEER